MGRLEAGAVYIYEKANGITYARKMGDPYDSRFEIGRDYKAEDTILGMPTRELSVWVDMINASKTNPTLQDALDRAKVIYELSKQQETVDHHPV
jgi:hypothetical protein